MDVLELAMELLLLAERLVSLLAQLILRTTSSTLVLRQLLQVDGGGVLCANFDNLLQEILFHSEALS